MCNVHMFYEMEELLNKDNLMIYMFIEKRTLSENS